MQCIVCAHELDIHTEEGDGWRCHAVTTPDLSQCECYLRKNRAGGVEVGKAFYSMERRVKKVRRMPIKTREKEALRRLLEAIEGIENVHIPYNIIMHQLQPLVYWIETVIREGG